MMKSLGVLLLSLGLTSCVHVAGVGVSGVQASKGKKVKVETSGMGILSLTTPSVEDLERKAVDQLRAKGVTKNVTTRLEMRNFIIVQAYSVTATGEK